MKKYSMYASTFYSIEDAVNCSIEYNVDTNKINKQVEMYRKMLFVYCNSKLVYRPAIV